MDAWLLAKFETRPTTAPGGAWWEGAEKVFVPYVENVKKT